MRLDESLVAVHGVFLQNRDNFAQGQRIAIRGLHVRVDGIPYTLPDGQAQVDAMDLDSAERIELMGSVVDIRTGDGTKLVRSPVTKTGSPWAARCRSILCARDQKKSLRST